MERAVTPPRPTTISRDAATAAALLPATPDGDYARRVLLPMMTQGTQAFVANVQAQVQLAHVDDLVLPLMVVAAPRTRHSGQAYVTSMLTHYVDYAQREIELELQQQPHLRRIAPHLLEGLRPILHIGRADQCVYVNNWLLSTNLYPPLTPDLITALHAALVQAFPQHSIVFRSLNVELHAELLAELRRRGYVALFSRQVYLLDPRDRAYRRRTDVKNDLRLARRTPYQWRTHTDLHQHDLPRLRGLYDDLYLHKYSRHNPQFTLRFFSYALRHNWATLAALAHHSRLDGLLGYIERNGILTAPLVGYDRRVPQAAGLYRLITMRLSEIAAERGCILHASAGAARFKRTRGAVPVLEYSMVFAHHLAPHRRLGWAILAHLLDQIVVPITQQHEL